MTLNSKAIPITNIPFPAITICNMNQARKSVAMQIVPGSLQDFLLDTICLKEDVTDKPYAGNFIGKWADYKQFLMNVSWLFWLRTQKQGQH